MKHLPKIINWLFFPEQGEVAGAHLIIIGFVFVMVLGKLISMVW